MATYLTNDEFAEIKGYTQFLTDTGNGYVDNNDYPTAAGLELFRERAYALINSYINGTPKSGYSDYLKHLEYSIVEMMIDEEQNRSQEEGRNYPPKYYIKLEDKQLLTSMGQTGFTRGTGT